MKQKPLIGPHGIDLRAPGGIEQLFAFNRALFGDARMEAGAGDGAGAGSGDGAGEGTGTGSGAGAGSGGGSGEAGTEGDEQLGEGGKKALLAEREANKTLKADIATMSQELQKLRDAGKTDAQRESDRVAQLEKSTSEQAVTIAQKDSIILRYQVAAAKGLDLEAAERLRGGSKEELEADADAWIRKWGSSRGVREVPGAGAGDGGGKTTDSDPGLPRLRNAYAEASK